MTHNNYIINEQILPSDTPSKIIVPFSRAWMDSLLKALTNNVGLIAIFITAFSIRVIFWKSLGTLFNAINADSIEYYLNSINLQPDYFFKSLWNYDYWYQRTPAYTLFLHLVHRELMVQMILSSLGCVLMYKMNKVAGMLWLFYLQDIVYSFNYNKESTLLFTVILMLFLFRDKRWWLLLILPIVFSGFVSYSGVVTSTHLYSQGIMSNFWHLWQPSFNVTVGYSKVFIYLQALPYTFAMLYFIRKVKFFSVEFSIFAFLSILYSVIYAEPRHRELFMPLLFLFVSPAIEVWLKGLNRSMLKNKVKAIYLSIIAIKPIEPIISLALRSLRVVPRTLL